MELKLLDLRRYAIDKRVEIKFEDPSSGHQCVINTRGQVKIPGEDKSFRIEDVLEKAQYFEVISREKTVRLARQSIAEAVAEAFKKRSLSLRDED
jgi:hypothetical protein